MFELGTVGGDPEVEMVRKIWDVDIFFTCDRYSQEKNLPYFGIYMREGLGRSWTEARC